MTNFCSIQKALYAISLDQLIIIMYAIGGKTRILESVPLAKMRYLTARSSPIKAWCDERATLADVIVRLHCVAITISCK